MEKTRIITHINKRGRFVNLYEQELEPITDFKSVNTQEEIAYSWYKYLLDIWYPKEKDVDFEEMNRIGYETTKKYFENK